MTESWRYITSKNLKSFGETDYEKRTITINKNRHNNKKALKKYPEKDRSIINTIVHEVAHKDHPNMNERNVRKLARKKVASMSRNQKTKLYNKFK